MYKVAVIMASGEMIALPYSNLKKYVKLFRQNDIYDFSIYSQESLDECFAFMKLDRFDSLIICSNACNDVDVKNELESHRVELSEFISNGHGVLVLLQYGLTTRNQILDIISPEVFEDTDEKALYSISPVPLDKQVEGQLDFDENSILLLYPNKIVKGDFVIRAKNNKFRSTIAPGLIDNYPHAFFSSPINYQVEDDGVIREGSLCIYSENNKKRVIITTLPVDLQEQLLLYENMISYVTRGRPAIDLLKCKNSKKCIFNNTKHNSKCEVESLLKRVNIHYTSQCIIDPNTDYMKMKDRAKYCLTCDRKVFNYTVKQENRGLPIRAPLSFVLNQDTTNTTVLIENKSIIKKWVDLGFEWINSKLDDSAEKWDTLYTTKEVALLYYDLGVSPNLYIQEKIRSYLEKHNINKNDPSKDFSFDGVENATDAAHIINDCFNLGLRFSGSAPQSDELFQVRENTKGVDFAAFSLYECAMEVLYNHQKLNAQQVISIFEHFVSTRSLNNSSWENDVLTTAIVLRALLKIEELDVAKDYIEKFNLICSCFEDESEEKLTRALIKSIETSREFGYRQYKLAQSEKLKNENLEKEIDELNKKILEQSIIEDRTKFHITIAASLGIFSLGLIWLFVGYIFNLPAHLDTDSYWKVLRDYILEQGIFQSILSFGALLLVAISFVGIKSSNKTTPNIYKRIYYWFKNKKAS